MRTVRLSSPYLVNTKSIKVKISPLRDNVDFRLLRSPFINTKGAKRA